MALTPNSGLAPYLAPDLFLTLYDVSLFQQLYLDGQNTTATLPTLATLLVDPFVAYCLGYGSGKVESAAAKGGKYLPSDLAALQGNSQSLLQGLVAAIAFEEYRRKRGANFPVLPAYADALETLKEIATGEAIFAFVETEEAGAPEIDVMTEFDLQSQPRPSNYRRYFGDRNGFAGGYNNGF